MAAPVQWMTRLVTIHVFAGSASFLMQKVRPSKLAPLKSSMWFAGVIVFCAAAISASAKARQIKVLVNFMILEFEFASILVCAARFVNGRDFTVRKRAV